MKKDSTIDHKGAFLLAHRASRNLNFTSSRADQETPCDRIHTGRPVHSYEVDFERTQRGAGEEGFRRTHSARTKTERLALSLDLVTPGVYREGRSRERLSTTSITDMAQLRKEWKERSQKH